MAVKRQKTNLPVIGTVIHHAVVHGRRKRDAALVKGGVFPRPRTMRPYEVDLKYAPIVNFGKDYRGRGDSMAKRARRMLAALRSLGRD